MSISQSGARQSVDSLGSSRTVFNNKVSTNGKHSVVKMSPGDSRVSGSLFHRIKVRLIGIVAPQGVRVQAEARVQGEFRGALKAADKHLSTVVGALKSGRLSDAEQGAMEVAAALVPITSKTPGKPEVLADTSGALLLKHLDKLPKSELEALRDNLAKLPKNASELVLRQLDFSVKAELLHRMTKASKDSDGEYDIRKMSKDQLVELRKLTTRLDGMVRPGSPEGIALPGTRFTWAAISRLDTNAETFLDAILKTEDAKKQVANGISDEIKKSPVKLKKLKAAVDFLIKADAKNPDAGLVKLQKDVLARIKVAEQKKTEKLIGPTDQFKARALPNAKLMELQGKLLLMMDLTLELEDAQVEIEGIISNRKLDAKDNFRDALRAAVDQSGGKKPTEILLRSLVEAQAALAVLQELNEEAGEAELAEWIDAAFRPDPLPKAKGAQQTSKQAEAVESDPFVNVAGMQRLRDNLTNGDGKAILNVLSGNPMRASKFAVAYLNRLSQTLNLLLNDKRAPSTANAVRGPSLSEEAVGALQSQLKITLQPGTSIIQSIGSSAKAQ